MSNYIELMESTVELIRQTLKTESLQISTCLCHSRRV